MTDTDDSEMRDLLVLAERPGRNPLVIQGPGGNISLKTTPSEATTNPWLPSTTTFVSSAARTTLASRCDTSARTVNAWSTAARRCGRTGAPLVVIPGAGVLVHAAATSGARAMIRCLADVTCRLASDDPIAPLSADDEERLLDWDAERYRQSLDARIPTSRMS